MSDIDSRDATAGPERMGERLIGTDQFGLFDWADPWPTYDRMRAEAPYWRNPEGATILTRYADCEAVLRDTRFSSSNDHADPPMTKDAVAGRIRRLLALADKRAIDLGVPGTEANLPADIDA